MNKIIKQMLDLQSNKELGYVYIFKVKFDSGNRSKVLYSLGWSLEDPVIKLQSYLLSFYKGKGYLPKAMVSRSRKVVDWEQVSERLSYELLDYKFYFGSLVFTGSNTFCEIDEKKLNALYDEAIPSVDGLKLVELLPQSFYLESELAHMAKVSVAMDEDYAVITCV